MRSDGAKGRLEVPDGPLLPLVILTKELTVESRSARELIQQMSCNVRVVPARRLLNRAEDRLDTIPDLLVSPLRVGSWYLADFADRLRQAASPRRLPILAVVDAHVDVTRNLADLRAAGVSGLVNLEAGSSHFSMRIRQIINPISVRAREARLPCFIPAELLIGSDRSKAVIVSLSPGGVRLAVARSLDTNTSLGLRFRLPGTESDAALDGRVTFATSSIDSLQNYEVGVAFLDTPQEVTDQIVAALASMLSQIES